MPHAIRVEEYQVRCPKYFAPLSRFDEPRPCEKVHEVAPSKKTEAKFVPRLALKAFRDKLTL